MRILSIDVGLKNLAYCILDDNPEIKNTKFDIIDWGLINVSEKIKKCDICEKPGKFQNIEKQVVYCGIHKKKYVKDFNPDDLIEKLETKEKCVSCKKENVSAYYKTSEGAMCASHKLSFLKRESKKSDLEPIKRTSVMKQDLNFLCEKIAIELDKKEFGRVDKVVIENQPSIKNGKMKSIQTFISCYFVIRFNIDKKYNTHICFSLASNKLKYDKVRTKNKLSSAKNAKERYCFGKELGITYAKEVLNLHKVKNKKWLDLLEQNKRKQDDFADSLMQGYYFLFIK